MIPPSVPSGMQPAVFPGTTSAFHFWILLERPSVIYQGVPSQIAPGILNGFFIDIIQETRKFFRDSSRNSFQNSCRVRLTVSAGIPLYFLLLLHQKQHLVEVFFFLEDLSGIFSGLPSTIPGILQENSIQYSSSSYFCDFSNDSFLESKRSFRVSQRTYYRIPVILQQLFP